MRKSAILCVDDEVNGLIGREALLKQKGYDVLISTSPREALKLLASCRVDAVVLDYEMPETRGDVVASRMKWLRPDVPIMLLSAHDSFPEEVSDLVDTFLSKSEPPHAFVAAVEALLAGRERFFSKWLRDWRHKSAA